MVSEQEETKILRRARNYFQYPNTHSMEIDRDEAILYIFVDKKVSEEDLDDKHVLPKEFMGLDVDVVEAPQAEEVSTNPDDHKDKYQRLMGGISIGQKSKRHAGTLGAVFKSSMQFYKFGDKKYLLPSKFEEEHKLFLNTFFEKENSSEYVGITNRHVSGENGTDITQPGRLDSRRVEQIGHTTLTSDVRDGKLDIGVITLDKEKSVSESILGLPDVNKPGKNITKERPPKDSPVWKSGRTTGVTNSKIANDMTNVAVNFDEFGQIIMEEVVRVYNPNRNFVDAGDSGSAVVNHNNELVGFIFAASDWAAYYIPMDNILKQFDTIFEGYNE